ncbi:MAG: glycosyltransferase [Clostridia bacterium]|nr:glycosyltransferase [Clostridia bacterium]
MRILYFGTVCNLTEYEKILSKCRIKPTVATVVFESALLDGFYKNGVEIDIFTYPMISPHSDSRILYWGNKQEKISCGYTCTWLKTINVPFLKQLSRRLDGRRILKKWLKEHKNEERIVLTYGISPFLAKTIISQSKKYGVRNCAIVPDLPRDMYINSSKNTFMAMLRKPYLNATLKIQGEFDSYIYLTEAMSEAIAPLKPYMVMEGILDAKGFPEVQNDIKTDKRSIMYAGGLNEKFGIINLLDAFEAARLPDTELWLFGDGNAVDIIRARAEENPNIRLFGRRDRQEVLEYEKKATLLVNPRSSKDDFTKYSFPSKTIEYMYSGTPLLTTRLSGIPEEYFEYVFSVEDNEVSYLTDSIKRIFALSDEKLTDIGKRAQNFVMENKNNVVQSQRIVKFLSSVIR